MTASNGNGIIHIPVKIQVDDEEEIKPKLELPYLFEKTLYEKQYRKIYVFDKFGPTDKVVPITEKFYSKYDNINKSLNEDKYMPIIENLYKLPIEKYTKPILESQNIGWPYPNAEPFINTINRTIAPKLRCDLTMFSETLGNEKITERPEFVGEKFFLR